MGEKKINNNQKKKRINKCTWHAEVVAERESNKSEIGLKY